MREKPLFPLGPVPEFVRTLHTDPERVQQAMDILSITQQEYQAINNRWDNETVCHLPTPWVYAEFDEYLRGWSPNCLNNPEARQELENILGKDRLPDFSMYVDSSYPITYAEPIPPIPWSEWPKLIWEIQTTPYKNPHDEFARVASNCLFVLVVTLLLAGIFL